MNLTEKSPELPVARKSGELKRAFLLCVMSCCLAAATLPERIDATTVTSGSDTLESDSCFKSQDRRDFGRFIDTKFLRAVREAEAAIFDENWPQARHIADSLSANDAQSPYALLIRAGALQAQMFSLEEKGNEKHMTLLLDSAETALVNRLQSATLEDSTLLLYFMGNCHAYRSIWEAKFGSLISAIKQGLRARDSYKQGIAVDSGFPDLYLGLGVYRYWKSAKSGILRWSGIVKDERQLGIEQVKKAVVEALISPDGAKSALMWILINEKDYQSAAEIAEALSAKYPHGATFLWPLAKCYAKMNRYTLARDTYLRIRAKLIDDPGNQINLLKTDYALYQLAKKLDDKSTIELVGNGFARYSRHTPRKTRRLMRDEYRILKRL